MFQLDERRFHQLTMIGMAAGLLLLLAAMSAALLVFNSARRSADLVRHTYQVIDHLSLLEIQLERAEAGRRGYLLDSSPYRIEVFRTNAGLAPRTVEEIAALTRDNPAQQARVAVLKPLVAAQLDELRGAMQLAQSGRIDDARRAFADSSASSIIRRIRSETAEMRGVEYRLLQERTDSEARFAGLVRLVMAICGVLVLAAAAAVYWLVRRYTVDLARARDRLHLLNTDLEGAVRERTADLQRANDEIQRFAYIVSHDLRSPLVNIMGFTAELETANESLGKVIARAESEAPQIVTDDVRHAREDLPEAIGFIRTSTQKMDRLINAILSLSREGRRNLIPEQLPMERILRDIRDNLEHRLSELHATIEIKSPMPDIVSDRLAIEQIFSNLVENAVKYLDPSRRGRITVRGRKDGDRVIYQVEDNGRGIDQKDHERIFDLFRRSGTQDQPGEGIGLAHVRALTYRLGGTVTIRSVLGEGATFIVNLPTRLIQGVRA